MKPCVLVAHHLAPDITEGDGGTFICTDAGTARDFGTVETAQKHIDEFLDPRVWRIFLLVDIQILTEIIK